MKHLALSAACLLLPLTEACAGSWVISGDIGKAIGDTDANALNSQITELGLNASASSSDHNRTAWQLLLGYQYNPEWRVEIGYVDLGDISTKLSGNTADINTFLSTVDSIHPQTAHGLQLSASYHYPIDTTSSIVFQAGLFDWQSKYKLETTTASHTVTDDGNSGVIGVGIEKEVGQDIKLKVNYRQYDIDGEPISIVGVGLVYTLN